jgi:hypothetical protein
MVQRIINFLLAPWYWYQDRKEFKKRLKELRDRDPFIYK